MSNPLSAKAAESSAPVATGSLTMNSTLRATATYFAGGMGGASFGAISVATRRNKVSASLE